VSLARRHVQVTGVQGVSLGERFHEVGLAFRLLWMAVMKELDASLRDLVAAVRAAYQPTLAHDALVRATIGELTSLDEPAVAPAAQQPRSMLVQMRTIAKRVAEPTVRAETERAMLAILASQPRAGETIALAFQRREAELRAVIAKLSAIESLALHRRLSSPCPHEGDELATQFSRLSPDRRTRLLVFVADARRREATNARGAR
jgi:hypothetical protein